MKRHELITVLMQSYSMTQWGFKQYPTHKQEQQDGREKQRERDLCLAFSASKIKYYKDKYETNHLVRNLGVVLQIDATCSWIKGKRFV